MLRPSQRQQCALGRLPTRPGQLCAAIKLTSATALHAHALLLLRLNHLWLLLLLLRHGLLRLLLEDGLLLHVGHLPHASLHHNWLLLLLRRHAIRGLLHWLQHLLLRLLLDWLLVHIGAGLLLLHAILQRLLGLLLHLGRILGGLLLLGEHAAAHHAA